LEKYCIGINKYNKVKARKKVLNAGLIYSLFIKGKSNKLHAGEGVLSFFIFNVFITNKFPNEAIKTPPKYTNPFISELNNEIITRKKATKIGDIVEKNCNILLKFNCIAIIYIITIELIF